MRAMAPRDKLVRAVRATRSPIRVEGERERGLSAAPRIGKHAESLCTEMGL